MRPTDLQTLLPRSIEITRTKDVEAKRPEVFQQHFVAETNRQYARRRQTVGGPAEARNPRIERDKEHSGGEGDQDRGADAEHRQPDEERADAPKRPGDQDQPGKAGSGRPDGTGRLVDVVIGEWWGRP